MSVIEDVRDRTDIVQLVSEYATVKKQGRSFVALCPFHTEKTPSFVLYPDEGRWYCFGACSTGGDVFEFVMRIENIDFRHALEQLARRAGVVLEPPSAQAEAKRDHREELREALRAAQAQFQQNLRADSAAPARQYLESREIGGNVVEEFGLGWAPDSWSALTDRLRRDGFSDPLLVEAGLARESERGGIYDAFRGRLTIPIRDHRGRTVGFGARTLDPDGQPKYLNSPQSPVFDKSRLLYALDRAAAPIRESGVAVVTEGYTDVIRAHSAGFENVVASLGTSLTEHHIARLKRYAPVIVLALDADAAGTKATMRGLDVAREASAGGVVPVPTAQGWIRYEHRLEVELRVAVLPEGMDPDDVIRADPESWPRYIENAQPIVGFLLTSLTADLDLTTPAGKTEASRRVLPVIQTIPDPVTRSAWLSELADRLRLDVKTLAARIAASGGKKRRSAPASPPWAPPLPAKAPDAAGPHDNRAGAADSGSPSARSRRRDGTAEWVLGQLLRRPTLLIEVNYALEHLRQPPAGSADFEALVDRDLMEALKNEVRGAAPPDTPLEHQLADLPTDHANRAESLIARVAADPHLSELELVRSLRDAVLRLRERQRRQTLERLRYLQSEAASDERQDYDLKVREVTLELITLQRLLAPNIQPQVGKLDQAVVRRNEI